MILLQKMTEADFADFEPFMIEDYAQDISRNLHLPIDEARSSSADQIKRLLGQGLSTPKHFLFNILLNHEKAQQRIGYLWLEVDEQKKRCFIYDIYIHAAYRRKGHGTETLQQLETKMAEKGIERIGLHVFAQNIIAHDLYSKMGYQLTGMNMQKWLTD